MKQAIQIKTERLAFTLTELAVVLGVIGIVVSGIWVAYAQVSEAQKVEKAGQEIRYIISKTRALVQNNAAVLNVRVDPGCTVGSQLCSASCVAPSPFPIGFTGCAPATGPGCAAPCADPNPLCVNGAKTGPSSNTTAGVAAQIASAGIFPAEMVSGAPGAYVVSSPWGRADVAFNMALSSNSCAAGGGANGAAANAAFAGLLPGQSITINAVPATTYTFGQTFTLIYGNPRVTVPVASCIKLLHKNTAELLAAGLRTLRVGGFGTNAPAAKMNLDNITGWCQGPGTGKVTITMTFPVQQP